MSPTVVDAGAVENAPPPSPRRPSSSSGALPSAALTLTFGGVDFRLLPSSVNRAGGMTVRTDMAGEDVGNGDDAVTPMGMVLELSNFTGTLRVKLAPEIIDSDVGRCSFVGAPVTVMEDRKTKRGAGVGVTRPSSPDPDVVRPAIAASQATPSPPRKNDERRSEEEDAGPTGGEAVGLSVVPPHPFISSPPVLGQQRLHFERSPKKDIKPVAARKIHPIPASESKPAPKKRTRPPAITPSSSKKTRGQKKEQTTIETFCGNDRPVVPSITLGQRGGTPDLSQAMPSESTGTDTNDAAVHQSSEKQSNDDNENIGLDGSPPEDVADFAESKTQTAVEEDGSVVCSDNGEDGCLAHKETDKGSTEANKSKPNVAARLPSFGSLGCPVTKGEHPRERWGQTMSLIDHSRVVVYGGQGVDPKSGEPTILSDLHMFDLSTRRWSKPINCEGVPRVWHTATFLPERQLLLSFGGEQHDLKRGKTTTTDQVMVLDTEIMLWYPPAVSGDIPTGRSGHTGSLLPNTNELIVFGGVRNRKWLNSLAVLDTARWKWGAPKIAGHAPRPRSYHTATPIGGVGTSGGRLVIFGGNDNSTSFNTVHVLDATDGTKWRWCHPSVSGTPPKPRTGHSAALLEDNKTIMVYGGWDPCADGDSEDDEETIFHDSFLLDTEQWSWRPGPRPKHLPTRSQVLSSDGAPKQGDKNRGPKRVGHSAVLAPGEEGAQVLVFGGRLPKDEFASDFQTLAVPRSKVTLRNC